VSRVSTTLLLLTVLLPAALDAQAPAEPRVLSSIFAEVRIPAIPVTRSGVSPPVVPAEAGHSFRSIAATRRSEATLGGVSRGFQS
jgi:hypothetical protein